MTIDHKDEIKRGEALFEKGDLSQAESVFKSILQVDPEDYVALNNLGVINSAKGHTVLAEEYFTKTIALKGDYLESTINLASLYQNAKRWNEASTLLERYLDIDDTNPDIYNQLGIINLEKNEPAKACAVLEKSLELKPEQPAVKESLDAVKKEMSEHDTITPNTILNILFVQEAPCIRNYKMATALRNRGHNVSLAYTKALLSHVYKGLGDDVYNECIKLNNYRQLWDMSKNYDIVHCHNEPDELTVSALAGEAPVVHDTHDLISLRANGDKNLSYFEGIANRGADGRIYSTPFQLEEAKKLYGVNRSSIVYYNYTSKNDLPVKFLQKLSDRDKQVHLVYEGGIGGNGHRDFSTLFKELSDNNIHIHIYPTFYNQDIADTFSLYNNIHYYHPLSPKQIIEKMTQYDFGIIPFNLEKGNKRFLDSTIANKLFEYLAAGLPVIASPLKTYIDFFQSNPVGITYNTTQDIIDNIPKLKEIATSTDFTKYIFTYEGEIKRLEEFYNKILVKNSEKNNYKVHNTANESVKFHRSMSTAAIVSSIKTIPNKPQEHGSDAILLHSVDETEHQEQEKYEQIYKAGYNHHHGVKEDIIIFISRYLNEFNTAIDLGCGTGKYAHYLQVKHKKMVLGVDIVNKIEFANVRFKKQFAWNLDSKVDLIYAIDLMEHIPLHIVSRTIETIAKNCEIFIADVSTIVDKLGDKIGKRLHVTVKPVTWWVDKFAEKFNEVKIIKSCSDGFFVECRNKLSSVFNKNRITDFRDWASVLQTTSTQYRDIWNLHAKSLPWKGKVLYVGSNELCKNYYNDDFFNVENVIHIDPDPESNPDIVAYAEDMSMFSDNSVDGVAFFGTPYVVNDPRKMFTEIHRILKPGGILSGAFNGIESPWTGKLYINGSLKSSEENWYFNTKIIELFHEGWNIFYWGRHNDEYYHLSALKT